MTTVGLGVLHRHAFPLQRCLGLRPPGFEARCPDSPSASNTKTVVYSTNGEGYQGPFEGVIGLYLDYSRVEGLGILPPNNGETNGKERKVRWKLFVGSVLRKAACSQGFKISIE